MKKFVAFCKDLKKSTDIGSMENHYIVPFGGTRACWYYWIFGKKCSKTAFLRVNYVVLPYSKLPIFTNSLPKYPILISTNTP